ncbi:sprouty-related, EVH1 domain-containing protein 2-like isoform X2 [Centruroides vittatus]|uniref:sprouty-related, EVH1 domain-containing protein 2-like isoform X2 n=1 Tax=Centruroides vittatus TaxID=120091 RepID=UPI00350FA386
MTEGSYEDGNCLVRVRAQVMTRDDSTGGWVPMGGGGLSFVSVRKRQVPNDEDAKHEYLIYGKRITDQTVVLSCTIKKDFQYNKVMPTFHHWRTGDKKFGLTFQTAADARAFDKGVKIAVEDLLDVNMMFLVFQQSSTGDSYIHGTDIGDDDVFMTLELPVDSRSSSGSSNVSGNGASAVRPASTNNTEAFSSPYTHPHANHHHLHRMHFIRPPRTINNSGLIGGNGGQIIDLQQKTQEDIWIKEKSPSPKNNMKDQGILDDKIEIIPGEPYSYVQFAKDKPRTEHEYSYPIMDSLKSGKRDSIGNIKKHQLPAIGTQPPLLPTKTKRKKENKKDTCKHSPLTRVQCRHCHDMFNEDENRRGSCEYAPDKVLACISATTCISCAQCMLYHCMSDTEGDFNHHPCSCDTTDEHCQRRWIGLALLSFFVPCLWCYIPFRACHRCGVSSGLCGGRHEAV